MYSLIFIDQRYTLKHSIFKKKLFSMSIKNFSFRKMYSINHILGCVCIMYITLSCSATKTVNCPPKFTIYKDINKAYPVYAKDISVALKNSLSTTNKIGDTASINIKQSVVKLRDNLNNISSRTENLIKSNLISYFSGICDENVRKNFILFQNRLADMTLQITEIETKIGNSKSFSNDNTKNIEEAISTTSSILRKIEPNASNPK